MLPRHAETEEVEEIGLFRTEFLNVERKCGISCAPNFMQFSFPSLERTGNVFQSLHFLGTRKCQRSLRCGSLC